MSATVAGCLLVCGLGFGCSSEPQVGEAQVGEVRQATIWGADDREDWREVGADLAEFGRRHVGVLARRSSLGFRATARDAQLLTGRTRHEQGFCDDQRFLCQPRIGYCSGTLLDGNLFATAGHCLGIETPEDPPTPEEREELVERLQDWCDNTMVVFNWREVDRDPAVPAGELPPGETGGEVPTIVTERDIYYCHQVLVHQYATTFRGVSFASSDVTLFTLKRDPDATRPQAVVSPYGRAPVMDDPRQRPSVAEGMTVQGIGFPAGLPMKFKTSPLRQLTELWAITEMDVLGGDSGGGLFAGSGRRHIAVLSQGITHCPDGTRSDGHYCIRNPDDPATTCRIDTQSPSPGARPTLYSLTYRAIDRLCGGTGGVAPGGPVAPPMFSTLSTPHPSYLCGTAPPVESVPYVPSPAEPEPSDPEEMAGPDPIEVTGCSAGGAARGLVLPFLLVLAAFVSRRRLRLLLIGGCVLAAACSSGDPEMEEDDDTPFWLRDAGPRDAAVDPAPDAGSSIGEDAQYHHVVSYVRLPRSRDALGLDLDGDGSIDSALGEVVELFDDLGVSLSRPLTRAIDDGRLRLLLEMRRERGAVDLDFYEGLPEPLDPSGAGVYAIAPGTSPSSFAGAATDATGFDVRADTFVLRIPLLDSIAPIELPLHSARIEGGAGEWRLEGKLGGALPESALRGGLFVPLAALLQELLASDPGCPEACENAGLGAVLAMMDASGEGELSVGELESFGPLAERLVPDIDTDGDGAADAISVGVEIEAVQASFDRLETATAGVFKAGVCFDQCAAAADCAECNSLAFAGCGWCPGSGCMDDTRMDECEADWAGSRTACSSCEAFSDCEACARDPFCGWCPGVGCVAERSETAGMCEDFQPISCR